MVRAIVDHDGGPFRVVVADPPWRFADKLPGATRGAAANYAVLSTADLMKFQLPPIADDALLLLWRVSSMVEEAYAVARAWGFSPKSEIVWVKTSSDEPVAETGEPPKLAFGMGRIVRGAHETCVVATRGRFKAKHPINVRTVFHAARRSHSEKPDELHAIAERLSDGPYCEMFARRSRPGWTCLGDEVGKLPAAEPAPVRDLKAALDEARVRPTDDAARARGAEAELRRRQRRNVEPARDARELRDDLESARDLAKLAEEKKS